MVTVELGPLVELAPVNGYRQFRGLPLLGDKPWLITSGFGDWEQARKDLGWGPHMGIDCWDDAVQNRPVGAAAPGIVAFAGWDGFGIRGWNVTIDHGNGVETVHCHLIAAPAVTSGQRVERGQEIGRVGATGSVAGDNPATVYNEASHLHFGAMVNGEWVDPLTLASAAPTEPTPEPPPPTPRKLTTLQVMHLAVDMTADSHLPEANVRQLEPEVDGDTTVYRFAVRGDIPDRPFGA